jgi:hypothetical protein
VHILYLKSARIGNAVSSDSIQSLIPYYYMTQKSPFKLLIQTNSPGELISWVKPLSETLSKQNTPVEISIFLTPCQYASGKEEDIAKNLPCVTQVYSPKATIKHLCNLPFRYKKENGAVLFLGGDPTYSKLLGLKHQVPVYGYAHSNQSLGIGIRSITKKEVGDLMADSVQTQSYDRKSILHKHQLKEAEYTVFFCGSRPQHFRAFLPFICTTIQHIKNINPTLNPIINISPFISDKDVNDACKNINTKSIIFLRANSHEIMSIAKLLITLPGTNTAEAMYLNVPMFVVAPLNRPDLIILDGLAGLIEKVTIIGPHIKRLAIQSTKKKLKFAALPNRIAKTMIVPEIVDYIEEKELADKVNKLLNNEDELNAIKKRL